MIYYNFFIASGAVLLTILTSLIFQIETNLILLFFIFFASTLTYNLDRNPYELKNFGFFFYLNTLAVILFSTLIFFFQTNTWLYLIHLALISLLYAIPRSFGKWYYLSLRRIPLLKIFIIAYGWANVTVILPLLEAGVDIFNNDIYLEFFSRFLFIFIITIPFDIGDYTSDKKEKIMTLPIILGIQNSKILGFILGSIFLALSSFQIYFWVHLILLIFIFYLTIISTKQKSKLFYKKYLDGTIHLYFLIYIILQQL